LVDYLPALKTGIDINMLAQS